MTNLHTYIEHTLLKGTASSKDIVALCDEAKQYNFYGVCVPSSYVYLAANELKNYPIKVITVVGFPLGNNAAKAKVKEAKKAVKDGADEIDMVMNLGFLKSSLTKPVREEISAVKKAIGRRVLKVIIESCYLSDSEIKLASEIAYTAGADFIKTSTGFGTEGATLHAVETIKKVIGDKKIGIKASGGIKTANQAIAFIVAGSSRIGTSNGVAMVYDPKNHET